MVENSASRRVRRCIDSRHSELTTSNKAHQGVQGSLRYTFENKQTPNANTEPLWAGDNSAGDSGDGSGRTAHPTHRTYSGGNAGRCYSYSFTIHFFLGLAQRSFHCKVDQLVQGLAQCHLPAAGMQTDSSSSISIAALHHSQLRAGAWLFYDLGTQRVSRALPPLSQIVLNILPPQIGEVSTGKYLLSSVIGRFLSNFAMILCVSLSASSCSQLFS